MTRARLEIATLYHEAPDAPDVKRAYITGTIMRVNVKTAKTPKPL